MSLVDERRLPKDFSAWTGDAAGRTVATTSELFGGMAVSRTVVRAVRRL